MRHSWYAQILPLRLNAVVCRGCGKVVEIGQWPTGRRAKCSGRRGERSYRGKYARAK